MAKQMRENRVPIMMTDEELTAIDDWRYANRVATRSDAIRRLAQLGIRTHGTAASLREDVREMNVLSRETSKRLMACLRGPRPEGSRVDWPMVINLAVKGFLRSMSLNRRVDFKIMAMESDDAVFSEEGDAEIAELKEFADLELKELRELFERTEKAKASK